MIWNWFVNKRKTERERFAGPLVIIGLVGAGLLLLVVLYPEKSLLKLLSNQTVSSPAQLRYLETLIHHRSNNSSLALVLARSYLATKSPDKALETLKHLREPLTTDEIRTARQLRYDALRQRLLSLPADSNERKLTSQLFASQMELMRQEGATRTQLENFSADATLVGGNVTGQNMQELLKPSAPNSDSASIPSTPDSDASAAIAHGDYRGAAAVYFAAMYKHGLIQQQRYFFLSGIRALQSGNLVTEALAAGETHINGLAKDRETLLFMARLALAANRPDRSQVYIRRALGMPATNRGTS